eukprot:SAG11_NODE_14750_length_600_cov_62.153693_1_plen_28_part_10
MHTKFSAQLSILKYGKWQLLTYVCIPTA